MPRRALDDNPFLEPEPESPRRPTAAERKPRPKALTVEMPDPRLKEAIRQAAWREQLPMQEWARQVLAAAAGYRPER